MIADGLMPVSDLQMMARLWLKDYISSYADHKLKSNSSHLAVPTKADVWKEYCVRQKSFGCRTLNQKSFLQLWETLYPNCELRNFVEVQGNCDICHEIHLKRSQAESGDVLEALQKCHIMHREELLMPEQRK